MISKKHLLLSLYAARGTFAKQRHAAVVGVQAKTATPEVHREGN